jgi:thymidylate kinase
LQGLPPNRRPCIARFTRGSRPGPSRESISGYTRNLQVAAQNRTLIVLLGIDGSGKSTVAEMVKARYDAEGRSVAISWARWRPGLVRWLHVIVRAVVNWRGSRYVPGKDEPPRIKELKNHAFSRWPLVGAAYLRVALFEYWLQYIAHIRSLLAHHEVVILDRYWYDVVIDAVGAGGGAKAAEIVRGRPFPRFPEPTLVILLDVDETTAYSRKRGENPITFLRARRDAYQQVVMALTGVTISATAAPAEVARKVMVEIDHCSAPGQGAGNAGRAV